MITRLAPRLLAALCCTSCVTNLFRFHEPAQVERVGLDAHDDDLVLIQVVYGLYPRHQAMRLLAIPHGWEAAAAAARDDDRLVLATPLAMQFAGSGSSPRADRFVRRNTYRWSAEARSRNGLLMADEVAADERRIYTVGNRRRADGSVDLELRGSHGAGIERVLAVLPLPDELTPPELSTPVGVMLAPPLAVLDIALIPVCAVCFVALIPFGAIQMAFPAERED